MKKVVFITGISSGFGKATSILLAQHGYSVYGSCRTSCEADPAIGIYFLDVTDLKAIENCFADIVNKEGRIDILINNAGMHTGGSVEILPYEELRLQMETNFMGAVNTIKTVLPYMRQQRKGTILNISSIGGLMALPFQGYYSASKFALEGLSEALRMEVRPFNIKVIVINPGDFHTHNTLNRRNYATADGITDYQTQFEKTLSIIAKDENGGWKPEILAAKLLKILTKKNPAHRYIIASAEQKLAVYLKRILPEKFFDTILRSHYGIK